MADARGKGLTVVAAKSSPSTPGGGDFIGASTSSSGGEAEARKKSKEFLALERCEVYRVSDAKRVRLTDMWKQQQPEERALVAFGRSFG